MEVPSVCYIIDHFCDEVDFFSIGSNDMIQYLYAVDRNNPRVSPLYNPITPSLDVYKRQRMEHVLFLMRGQILSLPSLQKGIAAIGAETIK